ncbi:MAG TPA: hypothetical protein VGE59_04540 [Patescibacteria group bacterium]
MQPLSDKQTIIDQITTLNFPAGQYIILGEGSLAIRGLRDTKDLDILVEPELFATLAKTWPLDSAYEQKWNRKRLKKGNIEVYPDMYLEKEACFLDVSELIQSAEIVEGIPLQPIDNLLRCKLDTGGEKDLRDVVLIKKYLLNNKTC